MILKAVSWLTRKGLQVLRLGYKMQQDNVVKTEYIKETVLFLFCNSQRQGKKNKKAHFFLKIQTNAHKRAVENEAGTKHITRSKFKT